MEHNPYSLMSGILHIWDYNLYPYIPKFYKISIRYKDGNTNGLHINFITNATSEESAVSFIKKKSNWIPFDIANISIVKIPYEGDEGYGTKVYLDVFKSIQTEYYYDNTKPLVFSHSITKKLKLGETAESIQFKYDMLYPEYLHKINFDYTNMKTEGEKIKYGYIKSLRNITKGSITHCKEAIDIVLAENKGALTDLQILQKAQNLMAAKKQTISEKKVGNDTNFYNILYKIEQDKNHKGILLKFGCESEQGSKLLKSDYKEALQKITDIAFEKNLNYVLQIKGADYDDTLLISQKLKEISGTLNEKVDLVAVELVETVPGTENTYTDIYIHSDKYSDKVGGILIYHGEQGTLKDSMRKLLHQAVTTRPLCLKNYELLDCIAEEEAKDIKEIILKDNERYNALIKEKELLDKADKLGEDLKKKLKEITEELTNKKTVNTPENRLEQVILGKLNKFKSNACFETQSYMFAKDEGLNSNLTVEEHLASLKSVIFDLVVI